MFGEDEPEKPTWPALRDKLELIIVKAKDWADADLIATLEDMEDCIIQAYPGVHFDPSDIPIALHDLNIPHERNEHNNKFYYLAKWR